jgi:Kef-type K+ transport system membrane component KefB
VTGVGAMLVALIAIFIGTKLFGKVAERLRQPPVLGELIAGVLIGGSGLGLVDPANPLIAALSTVGVMVLLFATGLETDAVAMLRVGGTAATVAGAGVVMPMGLGYFAAVALGLTATQALVCGAALCATSVGITARVLADLKTIDTEEGRVILGAAVIDDVIGLGVLAAVAALVGGASPTAGSAMIVGSFLTGVLAHRLPQRRRIELPVKWLRFLFVPVFFAAVGAAVDLRALVHADSLALGGALIACGIAGKLAAGFVPGWFDGDHALVGIGMIPRGEVGLIFAQMGLTAGAITTGQYGAVMLMVLVTTFVTPPALAWWTRRQRVRHPPPPTFASRPPSSSRRSTTP